MQSDLFSNIPDNSYYNTTKIEGEKLKKEENRVKSQEREVIRFFQRHPGQYIPRHKIEAELKFTTQSMSRALSNLTSRGHIMKSTKADYDGAYGKKVFGWMLNPTRPAK